MSESIFDQTDHPNEATRTAAKKNKATVDAVNELTHTFHSNHEDKGVKKGSEPDWSYLMRNAANQRERFEVMATRDVWRDTQKAKVWEDQQRARDSKVDEVLKTPLSMRNKDFYGKLNKEHPHLYFDTRIQKQRTQDRATLGLAFHLKVK